MERNSIEYNYSSSQSLKEICKPLQSLHITDFSYAEFYEDKSCGLLTNVDFCNYYITNGLHNQDFFKYAINEARKNQFFFATEKPLESSYKELLYKYNIYNAVGLFFNRGNYIEHCGFSNNSSEIDLTTFFINNIHVLNNFLVYFKERAKYLIRDMHMNNIYFSPIIYPDYSNNLITEGAKEAFAKQVLLKNVPIVLNGNTIYLTKREFECINYFASGKTMKDIANQMGLSVRTIETHLNNAKYKLGIHYKSQLSDIFLENKIISRL
jgi:DNA-binding CsgD family transcriptional regulator